MKKKVEVMKKKLDAFDFKIILGDVEWENDIKDVLQIDRTNLDKEFEEQIVNFAYYATLSEMAKDLVARCKREADLLIAHLDQEKRGEAEMLRAKNPKFKFTEKMIDSMVKTDKKYQAKQLELLDYQKKAGILTSIKMALAQKQESLISMGANYRASSGNSLRIMSEDKLEQDKERVKNLLKKEE